MSGNEIRIKIDENNEKIRKELDRFVLTDKIKKLMEENDMLRTQCKHHFIDGVCEYCDMLEFYDMFEGGI